MIIPAGSLKWGAKLAWMRTQLAKEQAFLEEARMPAKRLDFARSQLGKDYLSRSQQDSHALVARVQKVVKVREHYLAKHAGQDVPGSTDVLKPTGAWGAQLQTARAELEGQTETLVRDVVRRSLLGAFREGRNSPFDAAVEVSAADKALRDEALPLARKLLIDPSVKTPWITRESGPEHQGVDRIADAIQGVAPASPAPRRLVVFQDDRLTAFSAGANRMGVSEGLRTRLSDDPAAMAFVIGHETAHDRGRDIAGTIALHSRVASVRRVAHQARLNARNSVLRSSAR